jgi:hypothetical protein
MSWMISSSRRSGCPASGSGTCPASGRCSDSPLPSAEGYRVIWALHHQSHPRRTHPPVKDRGRRRRLQEINTRLAGPKTRLKTLQAVQVTADTALARSAGTPATTSSPNDAASDGCFPADHQRPAPDRHRRTCRIPVPAQPRTPPPPTQVRPGRRPDLGYATPPASKRSSAASSSPYSSAPSSNGRSAPPCATPTPDIPLYPELRACETPVS